MTYAEFLSTKRHSQGDFGFEPLWLSDALFPFQSFLVDWALRKGRCAIYADCGLGKTLMELVFAENVVRKTNRPVLILAPLAVSIQHAAEANKFGIEAKICRDGKLKSGIVITNYERLHYFDANDFSGAVCDESAILKNFDGKTKAAITEFMRKLPYRMLATATPAPNDYIEFGTSSEALGKLGYVDMLRMFFKAADGAYAHGGDNGRSLYGRSKNMFGGKFRFRGHAEEHFWRWICSWARALRRPSDVGFDDNGFMLPQLITKQHVVQSNVKADGFLFDLPAHTLEEQRDERRRTIQERCEHAARLAQAHTGATVSWCNLNTEGDLLEKLIPGSVQVAGSDSEEKKEEAFLAFANGQVKKLVTKCDIGGWGMNWQHCAHQTFFPSHSFEQWYQAVRRSWRFGQKQDVIVDVVTSEGEAKVLFNLQRKARASEVMFSQLVSLMNRELQISLEHRSNLKVRLPIWIQSTNVLTNNTPFISETVAR